ncbi:hypothetical protein EDD11_007258 [Mortierella claussenii]|nr:hypothetical protein EDD11_007258 [Mortierella claussenii]
MPKVTIHMVLPAAVAPALPINSNLAKAERTNGQGKMMSSNGGNMDKANMKSTAAGAVKERLNVDVEVMTVPACVNYMTSVIPTGPCEAFTPLPLDNHGCAILISTIMGNHTATVVASMDQDVDPKALGWFCPTYDDKIEALHQKHVAALSAATARVMTSAGTVRLESVMQANLGKAVRLLDLMVSIELAKDCSHL